MMMSLWFPVLALVGHFGPSCAMTAQEEQTEVDLAKLISYAELDGAETVAVAEQMQDEATEATLLANRLRADLEDLRARFSLDRMLYESAKTWLLKQEEKQMEAEMRSQVEQRVRDEAEQEASHVAELVELMRMGQQLRKQRAKQPSAASPDDRKISKKVHKFEHGEGSEEDEQEGVAQPEERAASRISRLQERDIMNQLLRRAQLRRAAQEAEEEEEEDEEEVDPRILEQIVKHSAVKRQLLSLTDDDGEEQVPEAELDLEEDGETGEDTEGNEEPVEYDAEEELEDEGEEEPQESQ